MKKGLTHFFVIHYSVGSKFCKYREAETLSYFIQRAVENLFLGYKDFCLLFTGKGSYVYV